MEVRLPASVALPYQLGGFEPDRPCTSPGFDAGATLWTSESFARGQLAIIVTEAAANIAAHAGRGELLLVPWRFQENAGIDVLALDNGKGIADVGRSLEDGYSTAGTAGQGLGAMSRLAAALQIYSSSGGGTALLARIVRESPTADQSSSDYALGAVSLAMYRRNPMRRCLERPFHCRTAASIWSPTVWAMGPRPPKRRRRQSRVFQEAPHLSPVRILTDAHLALAKTRGAAVSIAEILHDKAVVNYAGVGNIAGAIFDGRKTRSMVSMNGTLGHSVGRIQHFSYAVGEEFCAHHAFRWSGDSLEYRPISGTGRAVIPPSWRAFSIEIFAVSVTTLQSLFRGFRRMSSGSHLRLVVLDHPASPRATCRPGTPAGPGHRSSAWI